ncbi:TMEM175 family protein [Granulicella sibirica]|uniref:Integral membrane protein n=1 Tax=Granulicella sibirica TaxID=2479048 RepID=A0A4Q0T137_9BACT|nr:TMEM175 family protein [Granulicella sibirica]RXH57333.1 Integral membrane protein [Granulicella sibirica]
MPRRLPTPARLEAFSDGVIAVIITIMVLELKVPHQDGLAGLYAVLPTLLVYALSFTLTGIYWINHRYLIDRIERIDNAMLYANLAFLFSLSLLPFFTSYVLEKQINTFSVVLYGVSNIVSGFSFMLLRLAVMRHLRHHAELAHEDTAARTKHWLSLFVYACTIPLAFPYPRAALAAITVVTLIWILPNLSVEHTHEDPSHPIHPS